jgi:hypothetical protein
LFVCWDLSYLFMIFFLLLLIVLYYIHQLYLCIFLCSIVDIFVSFCKFLFFHFLDI